jgi:hypothetical protein
MVAQTRTGRNIHMSALGESSNLSSELPCCPTYQHLYILDTLSQSSFFRAATFHLQLHHGLRLHHCIHHTKQSLNPVALRQVTSFSFHNFSPWTALQSVSSSSSSSPRTLGTSYSTKSLRRQRSIKGRRWQCRLSNAGRDIGSA